LRKTLYKATHMGYFVTGEDRPMILKILGERLERLRKARNWSMADVARELGLPYTTYWGYEKGTREAGHDFIISVAKLYDVTSDYLLGLDDSENKSVEFYNNNDALLLANTYAKDPELMLLFKAAKNATPEGMKLAHDMLEALKRKEDGDDYEGIDEIRNTDDLDG